jgi:hypothetical protein
VELNSELFYADLRKFSAQSYKCRALLILPTPPPKRPSVYLWLTRARSQPLATLGVLSWARFWASSPLQSYALVDHKLKGGRSRPARHERLVRRKTDDSMQMTATSTRVEAWVRDGMGIDASPEG